MNERKKFSDTVKKAVYAKSNGKCSICGKPVKYKKMTIDHIVPVSQGGTDELRNLQAAHRTCNLMKDNCSMDEFCKKLEQMVFRYRMSQVKAFFNGREN